MTAFPEQQEKREADPRIASAQTFEEFFGVLDEMGRQKMSETARGVLDLARKEKSMTAENVENMARKWGVTSKSGIRGKFVELVQKELGI